MSKSIKVTEPLYHELIGYMKPRESFSDVIERVLKVYRTVSDVSEILGPSHYLKSSTPPGKGG